MNLIVGWLPPIICVAGGWWFLEAIESQFGFLASLIAAAIIFFSAGAALLFLNRPS